MFQAIISICNLINMECVILRDKIGLINTHKECAVRAENMRKDFIDIYKGPVIIEKNCIKHTKLAGEYQTNLRLCTFRA